MAIEHTPRNLYAGYAVKFDAMPYVKYADAIEARKQAKDAAIEQYFQKLPLGVNSAGMRVQDVEGFMKRQDETRRYWQQNKKTIKEPRLDNGKSQTEYGRMIDNQKMYILTSKGEEEKKKPLVTIMANPTKRELLADDVLFPMIDAHDLPLDDEKRVPIDYTAEIFNPKPYDQQKYFGGIKGVPMNISVTEVPDPKNPLRKIQTKNFSFNKDAIDKIVQYAETEYDTKPGIRKYVNDILSKPQEYNDLNVAFKKQFGRDIDATHPKELFTAHTLIGKKIDYQTQTEVDDKEEIMKRNQANQMRLAKWRAAHGVNATTPSSQPTVDFYSKIYTDVVANPNGLNLSSVTATPQKIIIGMLKDITGKSTINQAEVSLKVAPDGNMIVQFRDNVIPISAYDINIPATKELNASTGNKDETKALEKVNRNTDPKVQQPQTEKTPAEKMREAAKKK